MNGPIWPRRMAIRVSLQVLIALLTGATSVSLEYASPRIRKVQRLLTELHDLAESMIRITEVMADEPQLETMKTMVTRSERCLAEVERISKDLSKVTGDDALMTNLKSIVQSVSRILES